MKEVVIFKVIQGSGYDDYNDVPVKNLVEISQFEQISDTEYDSLAYYIRNQRYCDERFVMLEKTSVKSEEIVSVFEQVRTKAQKAEQQRLASEAANKKRQVTLKKKAEERKRKQLEKLKKEFGET